MYPLALLNTSIATSDGVYSLSTVSLELAKILLEGHDWKIDSAIGHESTAEVLSELLELPVAVNRQPFSQKVGQQALVFKLKGRIPEGAVLSRAALEEIGYELKLLVRLS